MPTADAARLALRTQQVIAAEAATITRIAWERAKLLIEPSAAVALAAVLGEEFRALRGISRVGVLLTGVLALMFKMSQSELAPEEDQGIVLSQVVEVADIDALLDPPAKSVTGVPLRASV